MALAHLKKKKAGTLSDGLDHVRHALREQRTRRRRLRGFVSGVKKAQKTVAIANNAAESAKAPLKPTTDAMLPPSAGPKMNASPRDTPSSLRHSRLALAVYY